MAPAILLTGSPGCGKTTLVRDIVLHYPGRATGFYTQEIRARGVRLGFEMITLDGKHAVLAHVDLDSRQRVGKYGVDLLALEDVAVASLQPVLETAGAGLIVIDEIGPMEILSEKFCRVVVQALQGRQPVLATIVQRSTPFTDLVKSRPGVTLIEVRLDNRSNLPEHILALLRES